MNIHENARTRPRSRGQMNRSFLLGGPDPAGAFLLGYCPTSPVRSLREISLWIIATSCFKRMPFYGSRLRRSRCSIPLTLRCRFESDGRGSETRLVESPVAARG